MANFELCLKDVNAPFVEVCDVLAEFGADYDVATGIFAGFTVPDDRAEALYAALVARDPNLVVNVLS